MFQCVLEVEDRGSSEPVCCVMLYTTGGVLRRWSCLAVPHRIGGPLPSGAAFSSSPSVGQAPGRAEGVSSLFRFLPKCSSWRSLLELIGSLPSAGMIIRPEGRLLLAFLEGLTLGQWVEGPLGLRTRVTRTRGRPPRSAGVQTASIPATTYVRGLHHSVPGRCRSRGLVTAVGQS